MTNISVLFLIAFCVYSANCHNHAHHGNDHTHGGGHHGHSHDDDDHGHMHDHHGHAHQDDHGHAHDDHGHDHAQPAHFKYSREANEPVATPKPKTKTEPPKEPVVTKPKAAPQYDEKGSFAFMNNPTYRVWVYSLGSTLLISAAPFFILFLIPIGRAGDPQNSPFLKVLLSFASGGLLGDALLHLIPHSLHAQQALNNQEQGHTHGHSHGGSGHGHSHDNSVGLYVLLGITTFLIIEKLVRIAKGGQTGHGHSHGPIKPKVSPKKVTTSGSERENEDSDNGKRKRSKDRSEGLRQRKKTSEETDDKEPLVAASEKSSEGSSAALVAEPHQEIKVAGYLNLAADFAHNFTDGLAVGASFIAGNTVGFVTTLTVLVHEIPHEIGDFAILIQSGCSKKSAMLLQLVTAFGAILGCCIALSTSDPNSIAHAAEASWVLPFTAGGFIYVATVSVIPELLENTGLWQSVKEILALFVGIAMMVLIAKFE